MQVFSAAIRGLCLNEAVGWHADKNGPERALRQFVALFTTGLTSGAWPVAALPGDEAPGTPAPGDASAGLREAAGTP
jgi:hypothetical protein